LGVFNKTIIPLACVGYEMIDSQQGAIASGIIAIYRASGVIVN